MITNFNPSVSKNSSIKVAKNNTPNIAFKRNFDSKEIEGLAKGKANVLNDVIVFIRTGVIRAQDGAKETLQELIKKHPEKKYLEVVLSKFPKD